MSPFTNTLVQWLPNEPSDAGFCGYLAEPSQQGLKAATCINEVNGTVCERPGNKSCLIDFYFLEGKENAIYCILNQLHHDFAREKYFWISVLCTYFMQEIEILKIAQHLHC